MRIEESLRRWNTPRVVLCLEAPGDVLRKRVVQRDGESRTPPLAWFDRVRTHFLQLYGHFPNAITVSTVDLSLHEVTARARALLENRDNGGAQA